MVRRAAVLGAAAAPAVFLVALSMGSARAGWAAALGISVAVANFAAHGMSLSWASKVSLPVLHAVALGGFVVRMAIIVAILFVLDRTAFLSPAVFGLAAVGATLALLGYEARLVVAGIGTSLQIPPEPAAAAAGERLRAREAGR
jgi:hypothetical protein